jgi:hypothetical protein
MCWVFCCTLLGSSSSAAQEPAPLMRLSWVREEAAKSCPDVRSVERTVRERLGRDPFADSAELAAEVWLSRDGAGFVARIQLRGQNGELQGERSLRSDGSCDTLADAVALALALSIDPDAALAPRPAPPQAAPAEARAQQLARPNQTKPRETAAPAPRLPAGSLSASMLGAHGLLPGIALAARLEGELALGPRFRLFATGAFFPEQSTAGGDFAFGLSTGGLGGCLDFAFGRISVAPCAAIVAGQLHSVVRNGEPTRPGAHLWTAASALARLRVTLLPALFLELSAGAFVPFRAEEFRVMGRSQTVFRQTAVAPVLGLGMGTTFR